MKGALMFSLLAGAKIVYGNAFALPAANPVAAPTAAPVLERREDLQAAHDGEPPVVRPLDPPKPGDKQNKDGKPPQQKGTKDFPPFQPGIPVGVPGPIQTPFVGGGIAFPAPVGALPPVPTQDFIPGVPFQDPNQFQPLCQTLYNNGFQTVSCLPPTPFGQGNCNTFLGGNGIPLTACNGAIANPCFTFFNNGQQQVTCTPTTTAQIFFTTSTQSFCNTFINGGATTTSCTTNFFTSATRTSFSLVNAAQKTGAPLAKVGQAVAGALALGAAAFV